MTIDFVGGTFIFRLIYAYLLLGIVRAARIDSRLATANF